MPWKGTFLRWPNLSAATIADELLSVAMDWSELRSASPGCDRFPLVNSAQSSRNPHSHSAQGCQYRCKTRSFLAPDPIGMGVALGRRQFDSTLES